MSWLQPTSTQEARDGRETDKIIGRAKQALGAVTGNEAMKREGERQEDKGKLKGKLDSAIGKTQDALGDLKRKVDRKMNEPVPAEITLPGRGELITSPRERAVGRS